MFGALLTTLMKSLKSSVLPEGGESSCEDVKNIIPSMMTIALMTDEPFTGYANCYRPVRKRHRLDPRGIRTRV